MNTQRVSVMLGFHPYFGIRRGRFVSCKLRPRLPQGNTFVLFCVRGSVDRRPTEWGEKKKLT